jgi:hypothetical protein
VTNLRNSEKILVRGVGKRAERVAEGVGAKFFQLELKDLRPTVRVAVEPGDLRQSLQQI